MRSRPAGSMLAGREFFSMVILEGGRRGGGGILSHYKCLYSKERDYKSTLNGVRPLGAEVRNRSRRSRRSRRNRQSRRRGNSRGGRRRGGNGRCLGC